MLPMILGSLISMFANQGLNLASRAIAGGGKKAAEFIAEKAGIDLSDPAALGPEDFERVRKVEEDPEARVRLEELALERLREENRHSEAKTAQVFGDKDSARALFQVSSEIQKELARKIFKQSSLMIPFLIIANIGSIIVAAKMALNPAVAAGVGSLLGVALGRAWDERKTIVEFFFGSSQVPETSTQKDGPEGLRA